MPDVLDDRAVAILRRLADAADPACSGLLSTLYAGDTWLAGHFGLRCTICCTTGSRSTTRRSPGSARATC